MHWVKLSRKEHANEMQNISVPVSGKRTIMSYEKTHGIFGNSGKCMSMQIENHLEIKIDKKEDPCEECIVGKVKQNKILKVSEHMKNEKK